MKLVGIRLDVGRVCHTKYGVRETNLNYLPSKGICPAGILSGKILTQIYEALSKVVNQMMYGGFMILTDNQSWPSIYGK